MSCSFKMSPQPILTRAKTQPSEDYECQMRHSPKQVNGT